MRVLLALGHDDQLNASASIRNGTCALGSKSILLCLYYEQVIKPAAVRCRGVGAGELLGCLVAIVRCRTRNPKADNMIAIGIPKASRLPRRGETAAAVIQQRERRIICYLSSIVQLLLVCTTKLRKVRSLPSRRTTRPC